MVLEEKRMNDYELIKNKEYYKLFEKYDHLFMAFYKKVPSYVKYKVWDNLEEFKQDCYPVLVAAVDSEKLERVKDPETFGLYIQLYHYLMNFTTRTTGKVLRMPNIENYEDLGNIYEDVDSRLDFLEDKRGSGYEGLYKTLTDEEKYVFDSRLCGVYWKTIQKDLGPANTNRIRESLREKISEYYN